MGLQEQVYPERFARSFNPIRNEILQAFELALPRFGPSPRIAYFKILDPCNKDCFYCDAHKIRGKQMNFEEVCRVLFNLHQAGLQIVDLTGGEPTLRPDLPQIIEYSSKLGMVTSLSSNGGIDNGPEANYQYWWNLAEKGLYSACFSYDGVEPKADKQAIHLAGFLSHQLHIMGGVRTVVTEQNLDQVYDIAKECILNNIFYQAVVAVNKGGETSAQFTPLDLAGRQEFIEIVHRIRKIRAPANYLRIPEGYLKDIVAADDPNSWHCKNPSHHWISIDSQGLARICNDKSLSHPVSLSDEKNPLLDKEFYRVINRESVPCSGCSWLCHWEGNRRQSTRGIDEARLLLTIALVS